MKRVIGTICVLLLAAYFVLEIAYAGIGEESFLRPQLRVLRPLVRVLSVGIGHYRAPTMPRLMSPVEDAQLVASTFSSLGDRAVVESMTVLIDGQATRSAIRHEYERMLSFAGPDDLTIFFFSGVSTLDTRAKVYLYPVDAPDFSSEESRARALDLQEDILDATPFDRKVLLILDGCNIGDASLGRIENRHPQIAILASSKADEAAADNSPFVRAILKVLADPHSDLDGDGVLSVEELYIQAYPKVVRQNIGFYSRQHPSLAGVSAHRIILATASISKDPSEHKNLEVSLGTAVPSDAGVFINGKQLRERSQYLIAGGNLTFLGSGSDLIAAGVNLLTVGREKYYLWKVGSSLKAFSAPYKNSRAIIVAIDDYDRERDSLRRGPTGFAKLTGMVARARELKGVLVDLGFPEKGIVELYDEDATSRKLEQALEAFWVGGETADVDRLFVYFGGHGDEFQKTNLLITYDYEKSKPLQTAFQAKDLPERQSRNIQAKHVLFALDVCYAGLLFLGPDEPRSDDRALGEIERLSMIERNVNSRARNIITAGTGDQQAVAENGGLFTAALIDGLRGKADPANIGVIEFDQLGIFVRNRVTAATRVMGYRQVPKFSSLDEFGEGRMMFIRPMVKN